MQKAGFFSRFVALLVDSFAINILAWIVAWIFSMLIGITAQSNSDIIALIGGTMFLLLMAIMFLFQFLYFGYFWSKDGQSIGMKLLGVKVVSRDGGPVSFLKAGLRGTIGYWISSFVFLLGFIWAAFDENGETWHDKIFGTRVIKA